MEFGRERRGEACCCAWPNEPVATSCRLRSFLVLDECAQISGSSGIRKMSREQSWQLSLDFGLQSQRQPSGFVNSGPFHLSGE